MSDTRDCYSSISADRTTMTSAVLKVLSWNSTHEQIGDDSIFNQRDSLGGNPFGIIEVTADLLSMIGGIVDDVPTVW